MDKFIVSARKYRPQNFNTVVGQSHITTTLKNAIKNNQLAHAFLFCGPRGVGKTTCARILAKTINCESKTIEGEACNVCPSCVSFDGGGSLNIHELDAASNNSVDDIRSLVEQVRFAPQAGKYKVYIVDEVHMLSASAFNAFLKTLEEPPSYAIFILATTEKHKILPTILSRCQIFDFKRITNNDTVEHLQEIIEKEEIKADKASLQIIAQKSEGCMRDALSILDKIVSFTNGEVTYANTLENLNILDHDYYFKLLEVLMAKDLAIAMVLYDEINKKGFEGDLVLNGFAEFIRNILVCKDPKSATLLDVVEGLQSKYIAVAANTNVSFLVSTLNILNEAEVNFKMARNKRLHVELVLIKLNFLQQAIELSFADNNLVKKKRTDGAIALKTKSIPSIQIITTNEVDTTSAKLYINQNNIPKPKPLESETIEMGSAVVKEEQKIISTPLQKEITNSNTISKATYNNTDSKVGLLDMLRDKYGDRYSIQAVQNPIGLTSESLHQHWQTFTETLKQQSKYSQANAFALCGLEVLNDDTFCITVTSTLQQKFIEQEKMQLLDYLQQLYFNRGVSFKFNVVEGVKQEIPLNMQLNSKERFERISAQYPLVKELKEKLKLNIE